MASMLNPTAVAFVPMSLSKRFSNKTPATDPKGNPQKGGTRERRPAPILLHPLPLKPPPSIIPLTYAGQQAIAKVPGVVPRGPPYRVRKETCPQNLSDMNKLPTPPTSAHSLDDSLTSASRAYVGLGMPREAITAYMQQDEKAVERIPKRPFCGVQHRWASRNGVERAHFQRFKRCSFQFGFAHSPLIPKTLQAWLKHKEEYAKDEMARYTAIIARHDSKAPKVSVQCMGGKEFGTSESAILAIPTIWSAWGSSISQTASRWPCSAEVVEHLNKRAAKVHQRHFPLPVAEAFDRPHLLASHLQSSLLDKSTIPTDQGRHYLFDDEHSLWNNDRQALCQQQLHTPPLSPLDLFGDIWKETNNSEHVEKTEEIDVTEEVALLGEELLEMLGCIFVPNIKNEKQIKGGFERSKGEHRNHTGKKIKCGKGGNRARLTPRRAIERGSFQSL